MRILCGLAIIGCGCVGIALVGGCAPAKPRPEDCRPVTRPPAILPDYAGVTLPPNIAPTNFVVEEPGVAYYVRIASEKGRPIEVLSRSANIRIPLKPWRKLLTSNLREVLQITISVKDEKGQWHRFAPIENRIAPEPIDTHVVYRLMKPLYQFWDQMGLYQRDLTSFEQRAVLLNRTTGKNCVNCHAFHDYGPDRMMFHMRAGAPGTSMILAYDGEVSKIDTKTAFNHATSYRSWHPNGEVIAFAFNVVKRVFHAVGENRDVYDRMSDLLLYNVKTRTVTTSPKIASPDRMETYPEWSPDGKHLYFCSCPGLDHYDTHEHPYRQIKYDLMRISYDVATDTWGEIEPVLLASDIDGSVAHAKISPDGRHILFCLSDCGYFPLYRPESDLHLLDIETGRWHKPNDINSNRAESYPCWSSNGRWVVFSSKRQDGLSTHFYISYFDSEGTFSKPFVLPQKDARYHNARVIVYNIPEFTKGPITIRPQTLIQTAWSGQVIKTSLDPSVEVKADRQPDGAPYESLHGN
jgi:Tol biopolymer transport system component